MILLGIDLGTSSLKALLRDVESGRILAQASQEYPVHQPQPGYAEQIPAYWWQACIQSVRAAIERSGSSAERIVGIGLSGQMHGLVCLNAAHEVLRPAIIWADSRSKLQVDALLAQDIAAIPPGPPAVGYMGPSLMWLAQHEPETLSACEHVLLPKDYLRFCLTGEIASDPSDAAATWLFDVERGRWSDALLATCGLAGAYLPPILPSDQVAGTLRPDAADALGLPNGIPVVTGCADQAAQALGYGLTEPGRLLVTIGTGGQLFMPLDQARRDPQLRYNLYNHAVAGRWYAAAAILAGGLALRWLRDLLGMKSQRDAYAQLSAMAAKVPPGANGLVFLPYLAGERSPHMDPQASGVFLGLRLHHDAGHMARAIMEGVCFALYDCLDLLTASTEASLEIIASGGAMASPVWRQILADIYAQPIAIDQGEHHACVGAALLAGVGAGQYASLDEALRTLPSDRLWLEPDPDNMAFYADRRELYQSLYPKLREDMHRLSAG